MPDLSHFADAMTNEERGKLYQLLARVDAALPDVVYCLMWGGLLGHVRFGQMTPWDDDLDLLIVDEPPIGELRKRLPGLAVEHYRYTKIFDPKDPKIPGKKHSFPFLEFIPAEDRRDGFLRTPTETGKPDDAFPEELIFPVQRGMFGGVEVNLPAKPREFVLAKYGPQCLESALPPSWSHRHERRTGYPQERVGLDVIAGAPKMHGFRWDDWQFTRDPDGTRIRSMDRRHTEFIYNLVMTGKFPRILEIGCHYGSSTAALVQALNDGADAEVHLCDPKDNPIARRVRSACTKPLTYHAACSLTVLPLHRWDLVIVDGNHSLEHVSKELDILLRLEAPTIIAHDVNSPKDGPWPGPRHLLDVLRGREDFRCLVDAEKRPGEWTDRGFLFATRLEEVHQFAAPLWERMLHA